jgi:hypothetical protein
VHLGFLLLAINRGNALGFGSRPVLTWAGIAAGTFPVLLLVERRAAHPILPVALCPGHPGAVKRPQRFPM